jgi:glycine/D-amino acid oxidase-like deaminating enzyme
MPSVSSVEAVGLTKKRDLRSGEPVWLRSGRPHIPAQALSENIAADVAVVGGGITGALVADAVLQAGLSLAVFDRRGFVTGSTAASTALLQFEIDEPLIGLQDKIGERQAARVYWRSAEAVNRLRGRVSDLKLKAAFAERHALYLPGNVLNVAGLRKETAARQRIGLRSEFIGRDDVKRISGISVPGAIWSAGSAEIDPVRLTASLWRSCLKRGARLFAPTEIVDIEHGRTATTLMTDNAFEVKARHVVFATGYEVAKFVDLGKQKITSTWAIATKAQPKALWSTRCLIWEAADPYLYIRSTSDGRVVVGGEDEDICDDETRARLVTAKTNRIAKKLSELMPWINAEPEHRWTGAFGDSEDGLPKIGPIPNAPRCFAVLGFGGNGITFGSIAAQMIQRAIVGVADPDADLFSL